MDHTVLIYHVLLSCHQFKTPFQNLRIWTDSMLSVAGPIKRFALISKLRVLLPNKIFLFGPDKAASLLCPHSNYVMKFVLRHCTVKAGFIFSLDFRIYASTYWSGACKTITSNVFRSSSPAMVCSFPNYFLVLNINYARLKYVNQS